MVVGWFPGFSPKSFPWGFIGFTAGAETNPRDDRRRLDAVLMPHGPRQDFAGQAIRHALIREDLRPDDAALGVRRVGEERVTLHGQARYAGVHRQLAIWNGAVVVVVRDE